VSEAKNFPFIVSMSSNGKKMKKQHKVFSIDKKMQILAELMLLMDGYSSNAWFVGINVKHDSKQSEIEKSYLCCGP
jgi:hypothetical protein